VIGRKVDHLVLLALFKAPDATISNRSVKNGRKRDLWEFQEQERRICPLRLLECGLPDSRFS